MHPKNLQLVGTNLGDGPPFARYERLVRRSFAEAIQETLGRPVPVHHDRKYVGKSGHEHQVDASAHLTVAGLSIFVIVECKFYSDPVSVGEVLEFSARVEDLSAHTGVLVASSGFQKGAHKVAESGRICLILLNHEFPSWAVAAGAVSGLSVGAVVGSVLLPLGTLAGAALGGAAGLMGAKIGGRAVSSSWKVKGLAGSSLRREIVEHLKQVVSQLTRRSTGTADASTPHSESRQPPSG